MLLSLLAADEAVAPPRYIVYAISSGAIVAAAMPIHGSRPARSIRHDTGCPPGEVDFF
jgi:hypothetical protein